jgi:hypothetical protein
MNIVKLDAITMRNEDRVVFCPRAFQDTTSIVFGKVMPRPPDVEHETFLGSDRSNPLFEEDKPGLIVGGGNVLTL